MKKVCRFPDDSRFIIESILDTNETQTYVCYSWDDIVQKLWVPNDFIVANDNPL